MLIEFRFQNHRSVRDEHALTFEATYPVDPGDGRSRTVAGHAAPLLTAAALYGANASGKSNVLEALAFMKQAVIYSHRAWEPEGGVPRDPFAWANEATAPSTYEVMFVLDGTRYRYGFVVDEHRFVEEWLHAWPKNRQQTWYRRDNDTFKYGEHLKGENKLVEHVTRPNALFLSAAVQHRYEQLQPVYHWFQALSLLNVSQRRRGDMRDALPAEFWLTRLFSDRFDPRDRSLFADDDGLEPTGEFKSFMNLLRAADLGILDLKMVVEDDDENALEPRARRLRRRVLVRHEHSGEEAWLPLEQESHGTRTLFGIAPAVVRALRRGSVLAIDELEANLHPLLAAHIVRQFHDPATNPRGAQIVFTTHDTNLLGTTLGDPLLRRDQIWLTEKDREGATSLYPLSDYAPRKAENIEHGYLQGRYGAIPFLGNLPPEE